MNKITIYVVILVLFTMSFFEKLFGVVFSQKKTTANELKILEILLNPEFQKLLEKYRFRIVSGRQNDEYIIITIKPTGRDDDAYSSSDVLSPTMIQIINNMYNCNIQTEGHVLREVLGRGFFIFARVGTQYNINNFEFGEVLFIARGFHKFGYESDNYGIPGSIKNDKYKLVFHFKENGEMAIFAIVYVDGKLFLLGGSKNCHTFLSLNEYDDEMHTLEKNEILHGFVLPMIKTFMRQLLDLENPTEFVVDAVAKRKIMLFENYFNDALHLFRPLPDVDIQLKKHGSIIIMTGLGTLDIFNKMIDVSPDKLNTMGWIGAYWKIFEMTELTYENGHFPLDITIAKNKEVQTWLDAYVQEINFEGFVVSVVVDERVIIMIKSKADYYTAARHIRELFYKNIICGKMPIEQFIANMNVWIKSKTLDVNDKYCYYIVYILSAEASKCVGEIPNDIAHMNIAMAVNIAIDATKQNERTANALAYCTRCVNMCREIFFVNGKVIQIDDDAIGDDFRKAFETATKIKKNKAQSVIRLIATRKNKKEDEFSERKIKLLIQAVYLAETVQFVIPKSLSELEELCKQHAGFDDSELDYSSVISKEMRSDKVMLSDKITIVYIGGQIASGKSTIGGAVARTLGVPVIDSDALTACICGLKNAESLNSIILELGKTNNTIVVVKAGHRENHEAINEIIGNAYIHRFHLGGVDFDTQVEHVMKRGVEHPFSPTYIEKTEIINALRNSNRMFDEAIKYRVSLGIRELNANTNMSINIATIVSSVLKHEVHSDDIMIGASSFDMCIKMLEQMKLPKPLRFTPYNPNEMPLRKIVKKPQQLSWFASLNSEQCDTLYKYIMESGVILDMKVQTFLHVTGEFKATGRVDLSCIGTITSVAVRDDNKLIAVRVTCSEPVRTDGYPEHITIAVADGVKAFESAAMLKNGTYKEYLFKQSLKFSLIFKTDVFPLQKCITII